MRYYFDLRENDEVIADQEGIELSSMVQVQEEASRSLSDFVRDLELGNPAHSTPDHLGVEVRSDRGAVLNLKLAFEMEVVHMH